MANLTSYITVRELNEITEKALVATSKRGSVKLSESEAQISITQTHYNCI